MRYLSLFSGIEAATVAWKPLGWECVAVSEIERFPCAVLAHHYPDVPNLGDVTKIAEEQIRALGKIDLVVFGSPCQDHLSRENERAFKVRGAGYFMRQLRLFDGLENTEAAGSHYGKTYPEPIAATKAETLRAWLEKWQDSQTLESPPTAGARKAARLATMEWSNGAVWTRNGSEWRSGAAVCSLSQILERGGIAARYFLSPTACAGILRRAEKRGKTLPRALSEALAMRAMDTTAESQPDPCLRDRQQEVDIACQPSHMAAEILAEALTSQPA